MISLLDYALAALIFAECVVAAFLLLRKESDLPANISLEEAFNTLDLSLKQSYPDLPQGYTWKETLIRIKTNYRNQRNIDWSDVENTLKRYEAFRYGGVRFENEDSRPILRLARMIKRREWIVR